MATCRPGGDAPRFEGGGEFSPRGLGVLVVADGVEQLGIETFAAGDDRAVALAP
ncbi:hypothetical protein [Rhodococcus opacus]|uniref:hypothetical protein n=1 Tax=Rhodococcus opacus TaxID=37919 RepID=UPI0013914E56|nr:hypothetical protein [Rhodococcus opacus]